MAGSGPCFHCGEPVTTGNRYTVRLDGADRPVCCPGCRTVAELIRDSGLGEFYDYRTLPAPRPDEDRLAASWAAWDEPALSDTVATRDAAGSLEAAFPVEGVRCAACAWLIERGLEDEPGLESVEVNPATARVKLRWDPDQVGLGRLLAGIARLGYQPHPGASGQGHAIARRERSAAIKRLGVAGIGMMQVMMYAVALYAGAFQGMDPSLERFLRLVSLVVATPVVLYAGYPFFAGAWRDLRSGHAGMDVPVALAIGGAYVASVVHTIQGAGEVYFDSVTMFVFFLSLGRFVEMLARHRTGDTADALGALLPASAQRISPAGATETVALAELAAGDVVIVRDGDAVPADGRILQGATRMDESLLTGEFQPRRRETGDRVLAGSLNRGSPIRVAIERTGQETLLSGVARLLDRAQATRPRAARAADRVARWFVAAILITAAVVFTVWWQIAPERAFEITLAVLVVTCPCALSLATPTALSAAIGALSRQGLLVARSDALEPLADVDVLLVDKTGTLTRGKPEIRGIEPRPGWTAEDAVARAASLEAASGHPLAAAFPIADAIAAEELHTVQGAGVEGNIDGVRHRIGRPDWVAELAGPAARTPAPAGDGEAGAETVVALASSDGPIAGFRIGDALRPRVAETVTALRDEGIRLEIISGDGPRAVEAVARSSGIADWRAGLDPADKLDRLRSLRAAGHRVAMLGDGVNDAPVLAGADVSVAMGSGTTLAQTSADLILLGRSLEPIASGHRLARKTRRVIRQNLTWAAAYNSLAMPAAALGWVQPWMAAIGMSLSSLVVVLNAGRLGRAPGRDRARKAARGGPELAEARS